MSLTSTFLRALGLSALALAAPALAQQDDDPQRPGTLVIEHGGSRIVVHGVSAVRPRVEVDGEQLDDSEWTQAGKSQTATRDGWSLRHRPSRQWAEVYSLQPFTTNLQIAKQLFADGFDGAQGWRAARKPHIGVQVGSVPEALAEHLELDATRCVLILDVTADGPADRAGLKANDILTRVGDRDAVTDATLREVVAGSKPGDAIELQVLRRGEQRTIRVEVGESADDPWGAIYGKHPELKSDLLRPYVMWNDNRPFVQDFNGGFWTGLRQDDAPPSLESVRAQLERIQAQCDALQRQLEQQLERAPKQNDR